MKLTRIRKTRLSNDTNCPALYRTDRGTYVVQGWHVQMADGVRDLGPGEILVEIPADVIDG